MSRKQMVPCFSTFLACHVCRNDRDFSNRNYQLFVLRSLEPITVCLASGNFIKNLPFFFYEPSSTFWYLKESWLENMQPSCYAKVYHSAFLFFHDSCYWVTKENENGKDNKCQLFYDNTYSVLNCSLRCLTTVTNLMNVELWS